MVGMPEHSQVLNCARACESVQLLLNNSLSRNESNIDLKVTMSIILLWISLMQPVRNTLYYSDDALERCRPQFI